MKYGIYFTVPGGCDILMKQVDSLPQALKDFSESVRAYEQEIDRNYHMDITLTIQGDALPWAACGSLPVLYIWPVSCEKQEIPIE